MKRYIAALAITVATAPALAADVGISINIGQPGFYGQIDIGGAPPPVLLAPRPMIIVPAPPGVVVRPVYLVVPRKHRKNWRHYCRRYNACGRPVYFVNHRWYNDRYVPYYHERHGHRGDRRKHHRSERREGHGGGGQGHGHGRRHDH